MTGVIKQCAITSWLCGVCSHSPGSFPLTCVVPLVPFYFQPTCVIILEVCFLSLSYTVTRRIAVFLSMTDHIYDSGPIRLEWSRKVPVTAVTLERSSTVHYAGVSWDTGVNRPAVLPATWSRCVMGCAIWVCASALCDVCTATNLYSDTSQRMDKQHRTVIGSGFFFFFFFKPF